MGEDADKSIRIHGEQYQRLKALRREGESVLDVLNRILPEDTEVVDRPEQEVVSIPAPDDVVTRVNAMAGENVSANDVIDKLIDEHETHD